LSYTKGYSADSRSLGKNTNRVEFKTGKQSRAASTRYFLFAKQHFKIGCFAKRQRNHSQHITRIKSAIRMGEQELLPVVD
jgi:hypothetical protein